MIDLPTQTVLIVGVGGAGSEASKQCAAFGMRVLQVKVQPTGIRGPASKGFMNRPRRN